MRCLNKSRLSRVCSGFLLEFQLDFNVEKYFIEGLPTYVVGRVEDGSEFSSFRARHFKKAKEETKTHFFCFFECWVFFES